MTIWLSSRMVNTTSERTRLRKSVYANDLGMLTNILYPRRPCSVLSGLLWDLHHIAITNCKQSVCFLAVCKQATCYVNARGGKFFPSAYFIKFPLIEVFIHP